MSMIKKVTLTINKNNTGVKLSSPLKFFKYDSFLLQFEIEQWNFETKQNELVKPMYAIAFVETPDGKDRVECTVLDGQIVQFQLLSRHTKHIGKGKLQIVVRDTHGSGEESCQSATPSFEYTVEDVIYDNYDSGILEDENGNIIITEDGVPVVNSNGFTTIDELEELPSEELSDEAYIMVVQNGRTYKYNTNNLKNNVEG